MSNFLLLHVFFTLYAITLSIAEPGHLNTPNISSTRKTLKHISRNTDQKRLPPPNENNQQIYLPPFENSGKISNNHEGYHSPEEIYLPPNIEQPNHARYQYNNHEEVHRPAQTYIPPNIEQRHLPSTSAGYERDSPPLTQTYIPPKINNPPNQKYLPPKESEVYLPPRKSIDSPPKDSYLPPLKPSKVTVSKHYFIQTQNKYLPPSQDQYITPPHHKHYKLIFIKASNDENEPSPTPSKEEKTLIYVLSQKKEPNKKYLPQYGENLSPSSKPEVFFVKYKTPEEVANIQHEIQAQYDDLSNPSASYLPPHH